jgi:hypothetical protein
VFVATNILDFLRMDVGGQLTDADGAEKVAEGFAGFVGK